MVDLYKKYEKLQASAAKKQEKRFKFAQRKAYTRELKGRIFAIQHPRLSAWKGKLSQYEAAALARGKAYALKKWAARSRKRRTRRCAPARFYKPAKRSSCRKSYHRQRKKYDAIKDFWG